MTISKHHNWLYSSGVPLAVGDRYYTQDLMRDFYFLFDRAGVSIKDYFGSVPVIVSGGVVTQGVGDTLNITSGVAYVSSTATIPDSFSSLPPTTTTGTLDSVRVAWTAQTNLAIAGATLDGMTVNYVKVAYAESNGNSRTRAKKAGSYYYELVPSYTITVNSTAPAGDNECCLATFTGSAGGTFTFATALREEAITGKRFYPGDIISTVSTTARDGFLLCDGSALSRTTYADLYNAITISKGTFTVTIATPAVVSLTGHGMQTGDCVELTTTGALPTGLAINTNYYVIYVGADSFRLASSYANAIAGTGLNTSGSQSGTHTLRFCPFGISTASNFLLPDFRGVSLEGNGQQSTAAWASAYYNGGLGHYKQDQMQAGQVGAFKDVSGARTTWGFANLRDNATAASPSFSGFTLPELYTGAQGYTNMIRIINDGTHGDIRDGYTTAGPRCGVNYMIKY